MNRQDVFNRVALALLAQGRPSFSVDKGCMYRGPEGSKCAAGHLIPDEHYTPGLEGRSILAVHFEEPLLSAIGIGTYADRMFVRDLQTCHDDPMLVDSEWTEIPAEAWLPQWVTKMRALAARYDLSPAVLDTVSQ
jgi:hypothetical protein